MIKVKAKQFGIAYLTFSSEIIHNNYLQKFTQTGYLILDAELRRM